MAITSLFLISPLYAGVAVIVAFVLFTVYKSRKAGIDHIPGPLLAKYSDAWRCWQAYRLNHFYQAENYQIKLLGKYGDAVRIGPQTVLVLDPEAINTVLGFKERLEKGPGYAAFVMTGTTQTALVAIRDEDTHGKYRRPVAHAYSLSSLKGYEPYIDDMIETLVRVLNKHAAEKKPINMSDWVHYWSFDVISKLTFGEPIGFLEHGSDFNGMIKSQKQVFRYIGIVNNFPTLDSLLKRNPLLKLFPKKTSVFFLFAKRIVDERIRKVKEDPESQAPAKKAYPDLLAAFVASKKSYPEVVTDLRIAHYCTTNVVAGANNSALTMDKIVQHLVEHPEAQDRLYQEILDTDSTRNVEAEKAGEGPAALELALKMPFLESLILEGYRTFGAPSNNLERIVSEKGMTLPSGQYLPPGTVVAMNGPSLNARKDVYGQDAGTFNPGRWTRKSGESEAEFQARRLKMDRASLTFGHGSRSCIGKNVVQLEVYKIWATLVREFEFEPVGTPKPHQVWVIPKRRDQAVKA